MDESSSSAVREAGSAPKEDGGTSASGERVAASLAGRRIGLEDARKMCCRAPFQLRSLILTFKSGHAQLGTYKLSK